MKRIDFYISSIFILLVLVWMTYLFNYSSHAGLNDSITSLEKKVDSLEIQISKSQRDTVIINLNLQKNGN